MAAKIKEKVGFSPEPEPEPEPEPAKKPNPLLAATNPLLAGITLGRPKTEPTVHAEVATLQDAEAPSSPSEIDGQEDSQPWFSFSLSSLFGGSEPPPPEEEEKPRKNRWRLREAQRLAALGCAPPPSRRTSSP
eukprot:1107330-Prorocentrum_minimum.AAC.1